jgi:hypothetical protein
MLCQLARLERWHACEELWEQADKLVRTLGELALKNPKPFRRKARNSLFMPSLRVRPKQVKSVKRKKEKWIDPFLGNSVAIAEAVELSADTIGGKLSDNRTPLGARCAGLVGECVQDIKRARTLWAQNIVWPTQRQVAPFRKKNIDDLIAGIRPFTQRKRRDIEDYLRFFCMEADCGVERLDALLLPELTRETAAKWWKGAIEKMVDARFPAILQQPLWLKELTAVSRGTEADMRKELKDYCRDKVKQFA